MLETGRENPQISKSVYSRNKGTPARGSPEISNESVDWNSKYTEIYELYASVSLQNVYRRETRSKFSLHRSLQTFVISLILQTGRYPFARTFSKTYTSRNCKTTNTEDRIFRNRITGTTVPSIRDVWFVGIVKSYQGHFVADSSRRFLNVRF